MNPPKPPRLPGRWLAPFAGKPTAYTLHPRRPWLVVASTLANGRCLLARHDLDTDTVTTVLDTEHLAVHRLAWLGDTLALCGREGSHAVVMLVDADGNGVLDRTDFDFEGEPNFVHHPHRLDLHLHTRESAGTLREWKTVHLRVAGGEPSIDASRPAYSFPDTPHWHPDGDRFAVLDATRPTHQLTLYEGPHERVLPLPWDTADHILLGWSGRDTLVVHAGTINEPDQFSFWTVDVSTGVVDLLTLPLGVEHTLVWAKLSPDGTRVAIMTGIADYRYFEVLLLDVATRVLTVVPSLTDPRRNALEPRQFWMGAHRFVQTDLTELADRRRVYAYDCETGETRLWRYAHHDSRRMSTVVASGHGRLLFEDLDGEDPHFLTDPLFA